MTAVAARGQEPRAQYLEQLRLWRVRDLAQDDPKALIHEIKFFDPVTQLWVDFLMYPPESWQSPITRDESDDLYFTGDGAQDWYWQSVVIDWLHDPTLHAYLIYKARQLGITLLACAYSLWLLLFRPGATCIGVSYEEGEAFKLTQAVFAMFNGLPKILTQHVQVITPKAGAQPTEWFKLLHLDGRISSFQAVPATGLHGHGARVTFGIMDEVAKQRYGREIYEAIVPATLSRGGKMAMISTADGVSNLETGEGNFFHHLYATKREKGLRYIFLPWNAEPTRGGQWYGDVAMKLPEIERNRQYPLNENDGFVLSGAVYFDREALAFYRENIGKPILTGQFFVVGRRKASFRKLRDGIIDIYEQPRSDGKYAIGVDTATGKGADYTVAAVIDLSSGAIVATMRAKIESPRAAMQCHYLGKWYNDALICPERQGTSGEAFILAIRDGSANLPPYKRIYRHIRFTSASRPSSEEYGHPMNPSTRHALLEQLSTNVRDRLFPWMPSAFQNELQTFVYKDTTPSPRAQDGCNDDCVMALALANEMWRQKGDRPQEKRRRRRKTKYVPPPTRPGVRNV